MEYLDENYNLVHHKTGIEVPDGADMLVYFKEYDNANFYKSGFSGIWQDDYWDNDMSDYIEHCKKEGVVLWQRTPSVDDEPTLGIKRIKAQPESVSIPVSELQKLGIVSPIVVDNINHPNHYTFGSVECIEAIEASMSPEAFKGFLKGNVQKYMWRYEQKGGAESLEKAQWYLNLLLSRVSS